MQIPGYAYLVYALAVAVYLAVGVVYWALGRRHLAIYYFEDAVSVFLYIMLILFIDALTREIAGFLGVTLPSGNGSEALLTAANIFEKAREKVINWIITISSLRAALSLTPITSPLSYVLGSATSWSITVFDICAVNFLFYAAAAKIFAEYYPYIIALGALMTPIPKLRSLGGALLSVALVYLPALLYYAHTVEEMLKTIPAPPTINPVDWINIAGLASNAAIPLAEVLVRGFIVISIASIVASGLARMLANTYVSVKLGV